MATNELKDSFVNGGRINPVGCVRILSNSVSPKGIRPSAGLMVYHDGLLPYSSGNYRAKVTADNSLAVLDSTGRVRLKIPGREFLVVEEPMSKRRVVAKYGWLYEGRYIHGPLKEFGEKLEGMRTGRVNPDYEDDSPYYKVHSRHVGEVVSVVLLQDGSEYGAVRVIGKFEGRNKLILVKTYYPRAKRQSRRRRR